MTTWQIVGLALVVLIGLCAVLCYATLFAEPKEVVEKELIKMDVERL